MEYEEFLRQKRLINQYEGIQHEVSVNPLLFAFQSDIVKWACRKGRAAVFADTGLGKTFIQLEWAKAVSTTCILVAPLSVARQTIREAVKLGLTVNYCRSSADVKPGLNITNYEMIENLDPTLFDAIVLDESSILKSIDGKTKAKLLKLYATTPFRLCCTATPAPNDIAEIANHSEFLGIMSRNDMLASFFVHDDEGWRLKGHAEEAFYRWMASWSMSIKKPSDIGHSDEGYILPPLTIHPVFVTSSYTPEGQLFFTGLKGIQDRAGVRKSTIDDKLKAVQGLIQDGDQYIVWCGLNKEADAVRAIITDSMNIQGSDEPEVKARAIEDFQDGKYKVMITKSKIAGFGMNLQNCHKQIFLGLSDSYEAYYQCIRRSYRFGQTKPVDVYIVLSDHEQEILANVQRKEKEAQRMSQNLIDHVKHYEVDELKSSDHDFAYETSNVEGKDYKVMLGDSVERMKEIPDSSIDLSVFSPPFMSLYTYSPTERDIGNCKGTAEFFKHFQFIIDELMRVTKPGRLCCVHCAEVGTTLNTHGVIGLQDFPGDCIKAFQSSGWVYHGRVTIDKNPQAQAIRTHSKALLFVQKNKDSSWSRPAIADYIVIFRKPGENAVPVKNDVSNEEWITWAHPIWYGIKETDTLNTAVAKDNKDERHICPLQLGTIERCVRLWSNKGETVFSPFMGIGSEGYESIRLGRKFIGIELKPNYFNVAVRNLEEISQKKDGGLF
ncbi:MAG: putative methyltransferase [Syntrophorhabdus sp. PtaU1.Bin050]|nr:MAG: putative methyltransferase [Syntrophorhabdus sp. PtaU1.Bin050]